MRLYPAARCDNQSCKQVRSKWARQYATMIPGSRHVVTSLAVFFGWTVTSYLCHQCGKIFLRQSVDSENSLVVEDVFMKVVPRFAWTLLLTLVQCMACLLVVKVETSDQHSRTKILSILYVCHFFATLTTNYSMAFIEASSTFAIKLTEPVVMAIVSHLSFLSPVPLHTVVSLPMIVTGVFLFSGQSTQGITGSTGAFLAFFSSLILAFRNVALKKLQTGNSSGGSSSSSKPFALVPSQHTALTLIWQGISMGMLYFLLHDNKLGNTGTKLGIVMWASGVFHVTYSYISIAVVLKVMDVVSHSVANIFKRLCVVLLLCATGYREITAVNFLGLGIAGVGLSIYVRGTFTMSATSDSHKRSSTKPGIAITLSMLVIMSMAALASTSVYSKVYMVKQSPMSTTPMLASNSDLPAYSNYYNTSNHNRLTPNESKVMSAADRAEFLKWRLIDHPEETDRLARTLSSNKDVIEEAQRVLINVMQDLLGKARHVMLMEIATYENKGDPAITAGEVMLLRKLNVSIVYYCSTSVCLKDSQMERALKISERFAKDELVILMQGGGNLVGYASIDNVRHKIISTFPDRKLVMFSQSIWLTEHNAEHLKTCQKIYSNRRNLVMFLRDRQSLGIAKKYFVGTKHILMPDMAFGMGLTPRQMPPNYDIIWLRRGDKESSKYNMPKFPPHISVHFADWWQWKSNRGTTEMETSMLIASAGFQFLQRGRIVVTDRLHGHILSTLMNIPHVLIDNPPFLKLSSFDKSWTASLNNTILISNGTLAVEPALWLLEHYNSSIPAVGPIDMKVNRRR